MSAQNPLTEIQFRIPFDQIEPAHVEPALDQLLAEAQQRLDALAGDVAPRTFENTLLELERVTEKVEYALGVVAHLEAVRTTPELRKAYNVVQPKASEFFSSIPLNEALWKQLKAYASTDEAQHLEGVRKRFLTKTLDDFRRSGADLDPAGKKRLQEIEVELSKLTTKFSENVLDATNAFELIIEDEARLSGLPPSAREQARDSAKKKGKDGWRFTLQAPSYTAVMTYLDDHKVREQVWREYATRAAKGEFDNRENIAKILELRKEKAQLLGYSNFADLVLEERMAKKGRRAQEFVHDLEERTRAAFDKENKRLREFRMSIEGASAVHMEPWDVAYYAEKLRKAEFDFDEEDLKPYFSYEEVKKGLFEVTKRLFGIDVRPVEGGAPVWHEDVQYYGVYDADGSQLGAFYADYFPREDKRGGAWMDSFLTGRKRPDGGVGAAPGPDVRQPESAHRRQAGAAEPPRRRDAVPRVRSPAAPPALAGGDSLAGGHERGLGLRRAAEPDHGELVLGARGAGHVCPALRDGRADPGRAVREDEAGPDLPRGQCADAAAELRYARSGAAHRLRPRADGDVMSYAFDIAKRFSAAPLPTAYAMIAGFTHLFASPVGYGAGYYSYKWAEALDADAFTRFAKTGVFDAETGRAFRAEILAKGDSEDPEKLFRAFMGRDPDPQALMVRLGLAGTQVSAT